jgi:hypothetical protein
MPEDLLPSGRSNDRTLERHLTAKIDALEVSLKSEIGGVKSDLNNRIEAVEKFFTAENKAAKDAVGIAMTAAKEATGKTEVAADERARTQTASYTAMIDAVMKRLDQIDNSIAASGGWKSGVGSSLATLFQVISSLGVIVGLIVVSLQHLP